MARTDSSKSEPTEPERPSLSQHTIARLGDREREVLEVLWAEGGATVQKVAESLKTRLAYTTVMTTLDRLYKKRLLLREKRERAFVYRPAVSRSELERDRAGALVRGFFARSAMNRDALLSFLVDAVQSYDGDLLQRLEEEVRAAKLRNEARPLHGRGGKS
jgi:predicted transcriptional regulator